MISLKINESNQIHDEDNSMFINQVINEYYVDLSNQKQNINEGKPPEEKISEIESNKNDLINNLFNSQPQFSTKAICNTSLNPHTQKSVFNTNPQQQEEKLINIDTNK